VSKLLDSVRDSMRLKRYYHNKRHPREMGASEIGAFLTHLAKERRVSGSTQNQALQAVLYLYRHVLQIEIGDLNFARAIKDKRLPTILTRQEVQNIFAALLQKGFHRAAQRAKLSKPASIHMLRHAFATHLIESGVGVDRVQQMLGHKDLQTTMIYVHTAEISGKTIKSPLDL